MEGIEDICNRLKSKNFIFSETIKWENISYVCGDYYFRKTNIK